MLVNLLCMLVNFTALFPFHKALLQPNNVEWCISWRSSGELFVKEGG